MYLGNPSLPVSIPAEKALEKVKQILEEKNWRDFESGGMKLSLFPCFYFTYHYFLEEEKEGKKIVSLSKDGLLALNATTLKADEKLARTIKDNSEKADNTAPEIEFEEKESMVGRESEEKVLQVKTAEFFSAPLDNVVISNVKKYFVPVYESFITIEGTTHDIRINAVNGEVEGIEDVPQREKGFLELTRETFSDLKEPKAWLDYSKGLAKETGKLLASKDNADNKSNEMPKQVNESEPVQSPGGSFGLSFFSHKYFLLLIIVLALFLIYVALFVN